MTKRSITEAKIYIFVHHGKIVYFIAKIREIIRISAKIEHIIPNKCHNRAKNDASVIVFFKNLYFSKNSYYICSRI